MNRTIRLRFAFLVVLIGAIRCIPADAAPAENSPATKSGFVTTGDGIKIHYLEAGLTKTDGRFQVGGTPPPAALAAGQTSVYGHRPQPSLLFVPGWTMSADIWEKQIAHFGKTHHVVAMDPRAQGQSTKAADGLSPAARARDIKAIVDQLNLAPVVLVCWSMGVGEAAAYVDQFGTDTLAALVLVDGIAGADFDPTFTPAMLKFAGSFLKDRQKATDGFVRSMYKTPQSEEYIQRVIQASLRTPTNSAMALFLGLVTSDNRPALTKIHKPTLIVIAAGSPWDSLYEDMHKRIAGSRLETIENAGHALFVDQPQRFNSLLDEFLKSLK